MFVMEKKTNTAKGDVDFEVLQPILANCIWSRLSLVLAEMTDCAKAAHMLLKVGDCLYWMQGPRCFFDRCLHFANMLPEYDFVGSR